MRHRDPHDDITSREKEVIGLVADGASSGEIGKALGISTRTVDFHVASIIRKLAAKNRTHAAVTALRNGIIAFSTRKRLTRARRIVGSDHENRP